MTQLRSDIMPCRQLGHRARCFQAANGSEVMQLTSQASEVIRCGGSCCLAVQWRDAIYG